jgi:GT2 family glycosyltransferase
MIIMATVVIENSIIVPTYNHVEQLRQCLESIARNTDPTRNEVWVVANGCSDGTEDYVKSLGPPFHLLSSPEPLGYTGAVNVGITAARGERVILLNDDAAILDWSGVDGWVKMLEKPLLDDPRVIATGPARDFWAQKDPFLVFFCVMIRKSTLMELGLLDMAFNPGAGEDVDFCLKAKAKGYLVKQVPVEMDHWETAFPIWHVGGVTCEYLSEWGSVASRNLALLEKRYPRTKADREFQVSFSDGLQNIHYWSGKGKQK